MDDFDLELKEGFLDEAMQNLEEAEGAFLALETDEDKSSILEEIFRLAHNLKGTSRAVGFGEVAEFTHRMEDLILKLKEGEIEVSEAVVNVLLACSDHIKEMIEGLKENIEATFDSVDLLGKIDAFLSGEAAAQESSEEVETSEKSEEGFSEEMVPADVAQMAQAEEAWEDNPQTDVPVEEPVVATAEESSESKDRNSEMPSIEEILAQAESSQRVAEAVEPVAEATPAPQASEAKPTEEVKEKKASAPAATKKSDAAKKKNNTDESIRVSLSRLDSLNNFVGELVILQNVLRQNQKNMTAEVISKNLGQLGKISKEIHEITMSLRMLPIRPTLKKLQRIVRDTSQTLQKKVNLKLEGEDTEVDKTVLEYLDDPLVHIVRNSVDHGLETPEERVAAGKSEAGNVTIRCFYEGNNIAIEVKDDGKGIDPDVIRKKAIEKKLLSPSSKMTDKEVIHFIFDPGFSTKAQVSEVSGRGVGMDVVRTNIESISGEILLESELGKGTTLKILLPLTMAIIDGLIASSKNEFFVLPLSQVHEMVKIDQSKIEFCAGAGELMNLRGETIPLYRLTHLLGKTKDGDDESQIAIIVKKGKDLCGIAVDNILHQQQIVVKKLGSEVANKAMYMGSSILGDGMPALIMDLFEVANEGQKKPNLKKIQKTKPAEAA